MHYLNNYIGGRQCTPMQDEYLDDFNPATGETYAQVPDSEESDVELAVEAAQRAFPGWSRMPKKKRADYLLAIAKRIEERLEELALAESSDTGKPLGLTRRVDIPRAAANFHFFGTALMHTSGKAYETDGQAINYTLRQPLGVVACISPWNLPLYLFSWKVAPALAAGNTVVAKPSELTPMTAALLGEICQEVKLPPGVLNIVHGTGPKVGQKIIEHPDIKAISFTGGTQTGLHIAQLAAKELKKVSLELGGKNPNIIFADAPLEKAIETSVRGSFTNQGQVCLCGSRLLIERSIYEEFKEKFVDAVSKLRVGDPLDTTADLSALISKNHLDKVLSYIEVAKKEGGTILTGGNVVQVRGRCEDGYFMAPTVIEGLSQNCRVNQEEIFGPVVTLAPFDTEEEAIGYANATKYGLASTIWTNDTSRAHRVAHALDTGIVWINCWMLRDLRTPFGGMKQSGVGREGGFEAMNFFTEEKNICVSL